MGDKGTVWLPEAISSIAPEVDSLFYFVLWTSTVIFVAVMVAMTYFAFRYRRRNASEVPPVVHESRILEMAWIVIPTILVLIVFTWGFRVFVKLNVAPGDAYQIQVRAKQWLWEYQYPNGTTSISDLYVPIGRPVRLVMSSEDVLHSFFVPSFRVKQDVLPNRYSSVWFEATREGTYQIFCTEYCGTQHSGMLGKVIVQKEADFQDWLSSAGAGDMTPEEYGELLFGQNNCKVCHSIDGSRLVGPSMQGLFGREEQLEGGGSVVADENYLRESILVPSAKVVATYSNAMPATFTSLNAQQLDALIAYIKTLQ